MLKRYRYGEREFWFEPAEAPEGAIPADEPKPEKADKPANKAKKPANKARKAAAK